MSTVNHRHNSTMLPPISMFTSRSPPTNHAASSLMPASPPTGYDKHQKSLPILPKPHGELYKEHTAPQPETSPPASYYHHPYTNTAATTPDQSTLWALFNQFQKQQQQQQQQQPTNAYHRSDDHSASNRRASDPTDRAMLSSEEVLAEKRRRNAGASARFRDRRKQRERELQDKCHELEQRTKEFEIALRRLEPDHPLLAKASTAVSRSSSPATTTDYQGMSDQHTLFDRVGQLEHMMTRFRQEKETDVQKLDELEKENKYLRSLLVPVNLTAPKTTSSNGSDSNDSNSTTLPDDNQRTSGKHRRSFDEHDSPLSNHKRIHLSSHNETNPEDANQQ